MGCGISRIHDEKMSKAATILVLGPESCGKTAMIRRLELALRPCDERVRLATSVVIRGVIRAELARVASVAIDTAALDPDVVADRDDVVSKLHLFLQLIQGEPRINKEVASMVDNFYRNGILKSFYDVAKIEPLSGSLAFVRDLVLRTSAPEYLPTDEELVLCQWSSRGIQVGEYAPAPGKSRMRFVDVGGTVPEQRKWPEAMEIAFHDVIFVVPLDAIFTIGPSGDNQMVSVLNLLRKVLSLQPIKDHPVFILFAKRDLLDKIGTGEAIVSAIRSLPVAYATITNSNDIVAVVDNEIKRIYADLSLVDGPIAASDSVSTLKQFINRQLAKKS